MPGKTAPSNQLYSIYVHKKWYLSNRSTEPLTYKEFEQFLMFETEILRTNNECKQSWKNFINWEVFKADSDDESIAKADLTKMRLHFDKWGLEHTSQYFEEMERREEEHQAILKEQEEYMSMFERNKRQRL